MPEHNPFWGREQTLPPVAEDFEDRSAILTNVVDYELWEVLVNKRSQWLDGCTYYLRPGSRATH